MDIYTHKDFKITINNLLKYMVEKVGNMHKQMENFRKEMETIKNVKWKKIMT